MPHQTLRLVPGVDTQETPSLNENSGISITDLIRFFPDRNGIALVQKLGGWSKFYPNPTPAIVRALAAWEDLDDNAHVAFGTQFIPSTSQSELGVITAGALKDITPIQATTSISGGLFSSTTGSSYIKVFDAVTPNVTDIVSVFIATQVAIGGVVLFGLYPCDPDGFVATNQYTVQATDKLGNPILANGTTVGGALAQFTTVNGSDIVTVLLANHGQAVGSNFAILLRTSVGGLTLFGNYVVQSVPDISHFTIQAAAPSTGNDSEFMNGGAAVYVYNGAKGGINTLPSSALPISASDWTLDNFGEDLIICPTTTTIPFPGLDYRPLYVWNPKSQLATAIPQAPPVNDGALVAMPQRQIVAWGSTRSGIQDPLLLCWCDVGNFNQWIPLVVNQAGSTRIAKGSKIIGCIQAPQQILVFTDIGVWSMRYIGPPYVYSTNEIGSGCGLISRKAVGILNGIASWMGPSQFYTLNADGVQTIPCPVWDVVFQDLDQNNLTKIRCAVNSLFGELTWFYPSITGGTGENDSYVKFNTLIGQWDYGKLARTAWIDQSVVGPPVGADPTSRYLYQHETSNDADGQAMNSYFQSGFYTLSDGDLETFIDLIWPNMKWGQRSQPQTANVQITFYVKEYPDDDARVFGPYTVKKARKWFNTRLRGRLISIRVGSNDVGSFWRTGAIRYRYSQDGKFG